MKNAGRTILVSGARGLIGSALCEALRQQGYQVRTLSRTHGDVLWDVGRGEIAPDAMNRVDTVVHLAGEPIAQRWTAAARKRILDSRVQSTALLVREIKKCPAEKRPALICASGIHFYGWQRARIVDETASAGDGFLASVCRVWENAAAPLTELGIRTVFVRTGVVLTRRGGALAKLLPIFKAGLGGRIGDGKQMMSWIALPDLVAMYLHLIENGGITGPVNAVAPEPVCNADFTQTLGRTLGRPTLLPLPGLMVRLIFGQMGQETLLGDISAIPARLQSAGFAWQSPTLTQAIREA